MEPPTPSAADRLLAARERSNKSARQVAREASMNEAAYFDLEDFPGELFTTVSLRDLLMVCRVIGIAPLDLFAAGPRGDVARYSFPALAAVLRGHLEANGLDVATFEDAVGWALGGFVHDPEAAWDWNVDCLRAVCAPLGVDWLNALPAT